MVGRALEGQRGGVGLNESRSMCTLDCKAGGGGRGCAVFFATPLRAASSAVLLSLRATVQRPPLHISCLAEPASAAPFQCARTSLQVGSRTLPAARPPTATRAASAVAAGLAGAMPARSLAVRVGGQSVGAALCRVWAAVPSVLARARALGGADPWAPHRLQALLLLHHGSPCSVCRWHVRAFAQLLLPRVVVLGPLACAAAPLLCSGHAAPGQCAGLCKGHSIWCAPSALEQCMQGGAHSFKNSLSRQFLTHSHWPACRAAGVARAVT